MDYFSSIFNETKKKKKTEKQDKLRCSVCWARECNFFFIRINNAFGIVSHCVREKTQSTLSCASFNEENAFLFASFHQFQVELWKIDWKFYLNGEENCFE